ncbi:hypothetical protein [Gordonia bronchialis]|uniref:hypothetical protein n=1 Tax=Gordonia bronchialis TaxID=2054 RepID=UPI001CBEE9FA|nr:hypothetical protein [Gordonia bronchialis]
MTRLGRNAIRHAEKDARRRNRQEKRGRRVAASVAALATVAAVGAGQAMSHAPAQAAPQSVVNQLLDKLDTYGDISLDPAANLGDLLGTIINNPASQGLLDQWRIQACASGGASGGADCSSSTGTGIALVLPDSLEVVPNSVYSPARGVINSALVQGALHLIGIYYVVPPGPGTSGTATVIGSGFQFAVAYRGGEATAISYLPVSLATAGASDGKKAYAFAIVGVANAWNTGDLPVTVLGSEIDSIPGVQSVGCYGGLTGAYAEGVGACANVLGTLDFRWDATNNQVQFGLTDPTKVLFDPTGVVGELITKLIGGQDLNLSALLSDDFARLTISPEELLNGDFLRLTSSYGLTDPITIDWLGQKLTLYPETTVNGATSPNYLGLPQITFSTLDTGEIIPVLKLPKSTFPFGIPSVGPYVIPSTTTTTVNALSPTTSEADSPSLQRGAANTDRIAETVTDTTETTGTPEVTPETPTPEPTITNTDTSTSDSDSTDQTEGYVGRHRADNKHDGSGYRGRHRAHESDDATSDNSTKNTSTSTDHSNDSGGSGGNKDSSDTSGSGNGSDSGNGSGSGDGDSGNSGSGSGNSGSGDGS